MASVCDRSAADRSLAINRCGPLVNKFRCYFLSPRQRTVTEGGTPWSNSVIGSPTESELIQLFILA
jgi:hypothetical protein